MWTSEIEYKPVLKLDDDLNIAMKKLETLERINKHLPGLDCGACGAPSCRTLAEDIVRGKASETDCSIILREKVGNLTAKMLELEEKLRER
jgi:Na+-translocating ferredoxin:NAD+ oxidoreductase RNF subunit RnfB